MKAFLCSIWIVSLSGALFAQNNIETILASIEKNNITLKALREETEAQKLANKTGIFLANPEVEFNYLWGNPNVTGNRTDVSIRQTFDIPTSKLFVESLSSRNGNWTSHFGGTDKFASWFYCNKKSGRSFYS
ncbi:hypothetical protein EZS27_039873, partial [termite gut metagenome]